MRIWKFTLAVTDHQIVNLPIGSKVLSCQMQGGEPQLWVLCDEKAAKEPRKFRVAGTGHPLDEPVGTFIGTFQMHEGALVFHVFETTNL